MVATTEYAPEPISAERLRDLIDADEEFALVDTRDDESFENWRIADAQQYVYKPDHDFDPSAFRAETGLDRDDPIVTICAKGKSSDALARALAAAGFENVRHVDGGMIAWSAVYDHVEIPTRGDVEIVQLQRRAKGCLGYLIGAPDTGEAAAIDPTRHREEFHAAAETRGWTIERVLDTHVHADHISGARALADELDVPYHLGEAATDRDVEYDFEPIERNGVVRVGDVDIKAVATPGHTSDIVSYLIDDEALCTGDTIFVDGVGRTELQFGDADAARGAELLYESLHGTVLAEPDSVSVLPGHFHVAESGEYGATPGEPVSTAVGTLRTGLELLEADRESFLERITDSVPEKPPNYERIISINRGSAAPADQEDAIELELGPNRCAAE